MKEGFQLLEETSKAVQLVINEDKTKYMVAADIQNYSKTCAFELGRNNFERVDSFTCLGSLVTGDSNISQEITKKYNLRHRYFPGRQTFLYGVIHKSLRDF